MTKKEEIEIWDEAIDEVYFQYDVDHGLRCSRHTHPMFYNGTFSEDNSYQPPKPEPLLTKEEFIKQIEDTESRWATAVQVLFSYIYKTKEQ